MPHVTNLTLTTARKAAGRRDGSLAPAEGPHVASTQPRRGRRGQHPPVILPHAIHPAGYLVIVIVIRRTPSYP